MATKVNINGKIVTRPGVYATTKSGVQNNPSNLDYGTVAIIDTGVGAQWGGGVANTPYEFSTIQDFRAFVKGGSLWDIALPLWKPVPLRNIQGASKVIVLHAREATAATITIPFTNGSIVFTTKDQGLNANGSNGTFVGTLKTGYAATLVAGATADKYVLKLWSGSYKGLDTLNNLPYEGVLITDAKPILITQSPECATLAELRTWLLSDTLVNLGFTFVVTITTTGDIVPGDIATAFIMAVGATEDYSTNAFDAALVIAKDLNCNFFLATDGDANGAGSKNLSIVSEVIVPGKYERFLFVPGYSSAAQLSNSITIANTFDSDKVSVVHGEALTTLRENTYKKRAPFWKTAQILGRLCGLEPQTPLTLKRTGIDAESSPLNEAQQELALAGGVIVTYTDNELGYNVVLQGINTLKNNEFLVNDDGSSHSIAVRRITAELNKQVSIFLKKKFFGNDISGPNRNTVTEEDLVAAVEGYLQKRTASSNEDNLIISFKNITATVTQDVYRVTYEFVPNFEISKFIITGILLEK
jgi:hypothetical protein